MRQADWEILNEIEMLEKTIKWFKGQIKPQACGWMYTTINGLEHRIKFLEEQL
tara:strand:+ start:2865 stop:3023 length:159 start_codon:yes stop_codon:yes gene_type:complete